MSSGILSNVSQSLGMSEAAIRLLFSILLGVPIALLHRLTLYGKCPRCQHIFFVICGLLICIWNYGFQTIHSAITTYITYLILKRFGGTKLSVFLTFVFTMGYLLYGYYETSTLTYDIKWTMPQCVLTLKLIGLAYSLLDGQTPEEYLSVSQKQVALREKPTLLEIAAYTYFPATFLVGPQFSMKKYLEYVRLRDITQTRDSSSGEKCLITFRDCFLYGVLRIFLGFIYMIFYYIGTKYIPHEYLLSDEFRQHNFFMRLILIGVWGHLHLYKYICCWLLAEGACTMFGLTFRGKKSGKPVWNGCENVRLVQFETGITFNDYIMSFNTNTNTWCAEYIYKRLKFMRSKMCSQFFTLLFLSLWHGFHSGYYMCFFLEFIIVYAEKDLTETLEKQQKLKRLIERRLELRILTWTCIKLFTIIFLGYCLVGFMFLSYPRYHKIYSGVYYCGHIIFLSYPLVSIILKNFFFLSHKKKSD